MNGHELSFFKKTLSILLILSISTIIFFAINSKLKKFKITSPKVAAISSVAVTKNTDVIQNNLAQQTINEAVNSSSHSDVGLHDNSVVREDLTVDDSLALKTVMQKFCSFDEKNQEFSRKVKTNIVCKIKQNENGVDVFSFKRLSAGDRKKIYNVIIFSKLEFTKFTEEATEEIRKLNEKIKFKKEIEAERRIDLEASLPDEILKKNTLKQEDMEEVRAKNEKSALAQRESLDLEQTKLDFKKNKAFFGRLSDLFAGLILFLRGAEIAVLNKF